MLPAPRRLAAAATSSAPAPGPSLLASCAELPDELLVSIFEQLDLADLTCASATHKRWRKVATDPALGLHRRVLLARTHAAFRRHQDPVWARKAVAATLHREVAHLPAAQLLLDGQLLFANAAWLKRRDRAFARCLFACARQLLQQRVPAFAAAQTASRQVVRQALRSDLFNAAAQAQATPWGARRQVAHKAHKPVQQLRVLTVLNLMQQGLPALGPKDAAPSVSTLLQLAHQLGGGGQGPGVARRLLQPPAVHWVPFDRWMLQVSRSTSARYLALGCPARAFNLSDCFANFAHTQLAGKLPLLSIAWLQRRELAQRLLAERLTNDQVEQLMDGTEQQLEMRATLLWALAQ